MTSAQFPCCLENEFDLKSQWKSGFIKGRYCTVPHFAAVCSSGNFSTFKNKTSMQWLLNGLGFLGGVFLLHFGSKIMITAVIVVYGAVTVYVRLS